MSDETRKETIKWYRKMHPAYEGLTQSARTILESLLKANNIKYLNVYGRVKKLDSLLEKVERKEYQEPKKEITDFAGIRIITLFDSDIPTICSIIRNSFFVDEINSSDKSSLLGSDKVGYRSVHFVCGLGDRRNKLPEFYQYGNLNFEIQVRTALQHAWAEIAHDRDYKISTVLPEKLKRELYLIAGLLEKADKDLSQLVYSMEEYSSSIRSRASTGDLKIPINTLSLTEFLKEKIDGKNFDKDSFFNFDPAVWEKVIDELNQLNVNNLADIEKILSDDLIDKLTKYNTLKAFSVLRIAMVFAFPEEYFSSAHKGKIVSFSSDYLNLFVDELGEDYFKKIIKNANKRLEIHD